MEQYLVAIKDGEIFYRLVDDVEALDNLFGVYGIYREGDGHGIIGCWKMLPPSFNEKPEGIYPDAEIILLKREENVAFNGN